MQATHLFLKGDDLGWGAPGLGDDLGWGGEATRDAQVCRGGPPPLGLLERHIKPCHLGRVFVCDYLYVLEELFGAPEPL